MRSSPAHRCYPIFSCEPEGPPRGRTSTGARSAKGNPLKRLRRTWLFVPGADEASHEAAARSSADVLIQELEDFTPPALRGKARDLSMNLYAQWRAAGKVVAVRVNPLETC